MTPRIGLTPGPNPDPPAKAWLKGAGDRPPNLQALGGMASEEPAEPVKVPTPPPYLGKYGRKQWRDLYRALVDLGVIADSDMAAFELLISSLEQCRLANEALAEHGPLIEGTRGTWVRNPAGVQLRESSALVVKLLDRFGLSPLAAARLGLSEVE